MSLSYPEASAKFKSGQISWDEYLDQLLARFAGDGHPDDDDRIPWGLLETDPFAYGLWAWSEDITWYKGEFCKASSKHQVHRPIHYSANAHTYLTCRIDPNKLKPLFTAYRDGRNVEAMNTLLETLDEGVDRTAAKKLIAQLALQDRRADVLAWILNVGEISFEVCFRAEADKVDGSRDPETFKVLEQSSFRALVPRQNPTPARIAEASRSSLESSDTNDDDSGNHGNTGDGSEGLALDPAQFDYGGKYPVPW